jgi:hypothetical protein
MMPSQEGPFSNEKKWRKRDTTEVPCVKTCVVKERHDEHQGSRSAVLQAQHGINNIVDNSGRLSAVQHRVKIAG